MLHNTSSSSYHSRLPSLSFPNLTKLDRKEFNYIFVNGSLQIYRWYFSTSIKTKTNN